MSSIKNSKTLFCFTSPRTVEKIVPEIKLLTDNFTGQKWVGNPSLHEKFFIELTKSDFYESTSDTEDKAFAGRDRITRAPKSYGFVDLEPTVKLTEAGKLLISSKRPEEVFLKQMLKFQLPSYYHTNNENFNVKPYLELIRLIHFLKGISKTELALFFLQMIHYDKFEDIVNKIRNFRDNAKNYNGSRKTYVDECFNAEIITIFNDEIVSKKFKTRQSNDVNFKKFIKTKKATLKDYADAYMRHLRATGLIAFEKKTLRLIIKSSKEKDVEHILNTIPKEVSIFKNIKDFKNYLFSTDNIELLSDNRDELILKLKKYDIHIDFNSLSIENLKDELDIKEKQLFEENLLNVQRELKTYKDYDDIIDIFAKIKSKDVPDAPLFLEWNVWRALVMINYSKRVDGNFIMDLDGAPVSTAGGNKPDIEAEYEDFGLITEVTMSNGQTQFKMEGDSVPRHFGKFKKELNKDAYCFFIAPIISEGTLAFYYSLNKSAPIFYGGQTKIIPLTIEQFIKFIESAKNNNFNNSDKLKNWLTKIWEFNQTCEDEVIWSDFISKNIDNWAA